MQRIPHIAAIIVSIALAGCMQGIFKIHKNDKAAKIGSADCVDPDASQLPIGVEMTACDGSTLRGLSTAATSCSATLRSNCLAQDGYVAVDALYLAESDIALGSEIAGIKGNATFTELPDCTASITTNCRVAGNYYAGKPSIITSYDVRINKTIGGHTGKLKFCRNAALLGTYNNTTSPGTAGLDVYDSLNGSFATYTDKPYGNDYYCNDAAEFADISTAADGVTPSTCGSATDHCMMKDQITGLTWSKANTSLDFSGVAAGSWPCGSGGCTIVAGNITGGGGSGAYAAAATMSQFDSVYACANLRLGVSAATYGGYNDWRLPTEKEMYQAYIDGLGSISNANFGSFNATNYWSASGSSTGGGMAVSMQFRDLLRTTATRNNANRFICVRP